MQQMFFIADLMLAQHVSGTIMAIIRSLRVLYSWLLPVVFGAWFSSCWYDVELRVVCPVCSWASNKICNKKHLLLLVGILFPHMTVIWLIIENIMKVMLKTNIKARRQCIDWHTHKEGLWISSNYLCTCCIVNCTSIDLNNTGQAQL
jgi:hypothetical protein